MAFMTKFHPMLTGASRDQSFIINMNQSPIPFTLDRQRTLELVGACTLKIRKSTCDTKRERLAVTIRASGRMQNPGLVFKCMPGGRVATRDFATNPCGCIYACQSSAWMYKVVMLQWVEQVLKPYILVVFRYCSSFLLDSFLLDSYKCHMMASVVTHINELGVKVQHIPGGCTGLCQPVDIGVTKPLKYELRNQWESWMIEEEVMLDQELPRREWINTGMMLPPKREQALHGQLQFVISLSPKQ